MNARELQIVKGRVISYKHDTKQAKKLYLSIIRMVAHESEWRLGHSHRYRIKRMIILELSQSIKMLNKEQTLKFSTYLTHSDANLLLNISERIKGVKGDTARNMLMSRNKSSSKWPGDNCF